jgi:hypothetical protein
MNIFRLHPFKAIWVLCAVIATLAKLPFTILYYHLKRPDPGWTVRQALMNHLMRSFLYHSAVIQARTPLTLESGSEGSRFVVIPPVKDTYLKGLLDDNTIRPQATGGTWHPATPPPDYPGKGKIVLHFHGGGYATLVRL